MLSRVHAVSSLRRLAQHAVVRAAPAVYAVAAPCNQPMDSVRVPLAVNAVLPRAAYRSTGPPMSTKSFNTSPSPKGSTPTGSSPSSTRATTVRLFLLFFSFIISFLSCPLRSPFSFIFLPLISCHHTASGAAQGFHPRRLSRCPQSPHPTGGCCSSSGHHRPRTRPLWLFRGLCPCAGPNDRPRGCCLLLEG